MRLRGLRGCVLVYLVGLPGMVAGHPFAAHHQILVSVINDAGAEDETIAAGEAIASRIYREAGLSIVWKNCGTPSGYENKSCIPQVDNRHLVLRIQHQPRTLATDVYGVAFLAADGTGAYCDVFYDRILELHRQGRASIGMVLGIVTAHELGHLLLGSHAHSSPGIMRPQWLAKEFSTRQLTLTAFSREQSDKMSARLERN